MSVVIDQWIIASALLGPVWSPDQKFGGSPALGGSVLIDRQSWHEAISATSNGP